MAGLAKSLLPVAAGTIGTAVGTPLLGAVLAGATKAGVDAASGKSGLDIAKGVGKSAAMSAVGAGLDSMGNATQSLSMPKQSLSLGNVGSKLNIDQSLAPISSGAIAASKPSFMTNFLENSGLNNPGTLLGAINDVVQPPTIDNIPQIQFNTNQDNSLLDILRSRRMS